MNGYMPSQNFRPEFTFKERTEFAAKYSGENWNKAKRFIQTTNRCLISKSAIKVSEIIKAKLEIDLFPLIIPIACKGFNIGGGTAAFSMYDSEGDEYLFDSRATTYKSMKGKYELYNFNGSLWIQRTE